MEYECTVSEYSDIEGKNIFEQFNSNSFLLNIWLCSIQNVSVHFYSFSRFRLCSIFKPHECGQTNYWFRKYFIMSCYPRACGIWAYGCYFFNENISSDAMRWLASMGIKNLSPVYSKMKYAWVSSKYQLFHNLPKLHSLQDISPYSTKSN